MALPRRLRRGGDGRRAEPVLTSRFLAFDILASTNDEAMTRLRDGDPGNLWIRAARQTGGRGRQGRAWQSPPGNLYASLALTFDIAPALAPQLGFVAGIALARVLRARLGGDPRLYIKWPNDMVFDGAKLAGLLLESTMLPGGRIGIVVGFGVNCRSHPSDLAYPATDLASAGDPDPDPQSVLAALAKEFAVQLAVWDRGAHFDLIRQAWLSLAVAAGARLTVALPGRRIDGTFAGLDPGGRLLLDTASETLKIDAGDVFLPALVE